VTQTDVGGLSLPWGTDAGLSGHLTSVLLADVTLYDERGRVFWAQTGPALFTPHQTDALDMRSGATSVLRADIADRAIGSLAVDCVASRSGRGSALAAVTLWLRTDALNRWFQTSY
jgi:hypothetical protein